MEKKHKKLPIRLFHKREIDTRETEGGGNNLDPKWVLSDELLLEYSKEKLFEIDLIENEIEFDSYGRLDIPLTIGVEIIIEAIAKTHRDPIENLFSSKFEKLSSVGFSPTNFLLFPVDKLEHIKNAKTIFETPEKNSKAVSSIKSIEKYKPFIEKDLSINDEIKIKFIDYRNKEIQKKVETKFENFCRNKKINFQKCFYAPSLKIYKINKVTKDSLDQIVNLDGILSISSMPKYEITLEKEDFYETVPIKKPINGKRYPIVGILDSGIAKNKYLAPWIIDGYSPYDDAELDKSHGTFVAGVLIYGRDFLKCLDSLTNTCNIFDAAVISDDNLGIVDEYELLDNIREVIELKSNEIKIWSLSLGSNKEAHTEIFSDFAISLDYIQDKENVIIVKSAGNCNNFENNLPVSRISESSDSVRSIVVGSIAHYKNQTDFAKINHHSPFSRVGPGPQGIVKPDLVHYGGNSGLSNDGVRIDTGIPSFDIAGRIVKKIGTSFSTPQISAILADLNENLKGNFMVCY